MPKEPTVLTFTYPRALSSRASPMERRERVEAHVLQREQIHPYNRRRLGSRVELVRPPLGHSGRPGFDTDNAPSLTRAKKKMEAIIKNHHSKINLVKKFLYWGLVLAAATRAAGAGTSAILAAETANDELRTAGWFERTKTAERRGREPWLPLSVRVNMQLAIDYIANANPSDLPEDAVSLIMDAWAGLKGAVRQLSYSKLLYHVYINRHSIGSAAKWMKELALRAVRATRGSAEARDVERVVEVENADEGAVADARRAEVAVAEEEEMERIEDEDNLEAAQWLAKEPWRRKQAALREQALRKLASAQSIGFSHPRGNRPMPTTGMGRAIEQASAQRKGFSHPSRRTPSGGKKTKHKRKKRNRCASKKYKKSSKRKRRCCASKKHRRSSKSKRSPTRRSRM